MGEFLTVKELAKYLKVNPMTIYRLLKGGKIPAFKVSSEWRFKKTSINRWVENQENNNRHARKEQKK